MVISTLWELRKDKLDINDSSRYDIHDIKNKEKRQW